MDWFVDVLKSYGPAAIAVVAGMVIVILLISMIDRHNTGKPTSEARKKEAPRDDH